MLGTIKQGVIVRVRSKLREQTPKTNCFPEDLWTLFGHFMCNPKVNHITHNYLLAYIQDNFNMLTRCFDNGQL